MEESYFEENDETWLEKKATTERRDSVITKECRDSVRQIVPPKRQRRWQSVEEYQEWKRLRRELDDLDFFNRS